MPKSQSMTKPSIVAVQEPFDILPHCLSTPSSFSIANFAESSNSKGHSIPLVSKLNLNVSE
jgi:hypothetical protein